MGGFDLPGGSCVCHDLAVNMKWVSLVFCGVLWAGAGALKAEDAPQWGERLTRNMVSGETGLPVGFDVESGENVKWSVPLGTRTYSTPVVADGRIYVGTNNEVPRDGRFEGDYGVLLCLSEADGSLIWQLSVPKLPEERSYQDWPNTGIASPPVVEGDILYLVSNRNEVMALDVEGQTDGNDGVFLEEGRHMAAAGAAPMEVREGDADILWLVDLREALGVEAHDAVHCAVLSQGRYLYVCTSNGVDAKHDYMVAAEAPSLVVLEKATGKVVARDREAIGPNIVHSTWSSPALVEVEGRKIVVFGGGDGVCYGFEALTPEAVSAATGEVVDLKKVWWFDCDPEGPKEAVHSYRGNRETSASNIYGMPVVHGGRVYITAGGDFWHGKRASWLICFDPSGEGDLTESAEVWRYRLVKHCMATPSVAEGLVYIADTSGRLHCIDAETGEGVWVHDTHGVCWGSPLVADGKVYLVNQEGKYVVLAAGREKEVLGEVALRDAVNGSPVAANGVLYVTGMTRLWALEEQKWAMKTMELDVRIDGMGGKSTVLRFRLGYSF
jgi:outer membrane protein assembly factor BamB